MKLPFAKTIAGVVCVSALGALVAEALAVADLFAFEYAALWQLLGPSGVVLLLALNAGLVALALLSWSAATRRPMRWQRLNIVVVALAGVGAALVAQYLLLEVPLTVRLALRGVDGTPAVTLADPQDFESFSLAHSAPSEAALERLAVLYARIRVNNPEPYDLHPIGATIDRYAARYRVDPTLLFFLNYIDSFYGEAVSGPLPFARAMTAETVRDVVQIHLPSWVVESRWREAFVRSRWIDRLVGDALGFKLRYAAHKFTLDVSSQPYALNTYSDIFLVLQEYPEEFRDVLEAASVGPIRVALRDSFLALRDRALSPPYEEPYEQPILGPEFYSAHRTDLKKFARAAYYLVTLDFDFATRVQALLSRYQENYYARRLGEVEWLDMPEWQRAAMLVMIRDLYMHNVGHPAYNLYALPELNCTPLEFVASSAIDDALKLGSNQSELWRPEDYGALWGGATYRLRVFNEVWSLTHPNPLPGLGVEDTAVEASKIVALSSN